MSLKSNEENNKRQRDEDLNYLNASAPKKSAYSKCTTQMINSFTQKLTKYISELEDLESSLKNTSSKTYESSAELRRKTQLKTEETIAELKILNGFGINDEESTLPLELQFEIEKIQKNSDALIEKTDSYEKMLNSDLDSYKLLDEVEKMKRLASHWNSILNSKGISEKTELYQARLELNGFCLKEMKHKIKYLPVNSKQMLFIENQNNIGQMQIEETIPYDNLNIFRFSVVSSYISKPCMTFGLLDNGNLVVTGLRAFIILIYDPIEKKEIKIKYLDKKIQKIFVYKDKIALFLYYQARYEIVIMDENLNIINREGTFKHGANDFIIGANDTYLYVNQHFRRSIVRKNWDLDETKMELVFQEAKNTDPFFISPYYMYIDQFEKRGKISIIKGNGRYFFIFDEIGNLIKKIEINGSFVVDSKNQIIILSENKLFYHDLNGDLVKTVFLEPNIKYKKIVSQIQIDSADKLYFA